jgi:hypothetical protein
MRIFILSLIIPLVGACTYSVHEVYSSGFDPYSEYGKGKIVTSQKEQFTFLGFVGNTDYVDEAYRDIQMQCTEGEIKGITTQYSTSHGFFSWTHRILMQGMCVARLD